MNKVWLLLVLSSIIFLLFVSPDKVLTAMLGASQKALSLSITLCAVYAVWLGILKIVEDSGLNKKLARLFRPIIRLLFGKLDEQTASFIALNLSANMLGMGNACTPMGIKAMKSLDNGSSVATRAMIMFVVINCTSIQLIPTTIIGLRTALNSINPADIILPSLISTAVSTLSGIFMVFLISKIKFKKRLTATNKISNLRARVYD